MKKKKTEVEDGEEETDNDNQQAELDNQQNNDDSKYFTFYRYGFLLAFKVIVAK